MLSEFRVSGLARIANAAPEEILRQARDECRVFLPSEPQARFWEAAIEQAILEQQAPWAMKLQARAFKIAEQYTGPAPTLIQNQIAFLPSGAPTGLGGHVDGKRLMRLSGNNFRKMPNFQVIIGFPLVDQSTPNRGQLWYNPGGHLRVVRFIFDNWNELEAAAGDESFDRLFRFVNEECTERRTVLSSLGDAFVFHAGLPHGSITNQGPDRLTWYFRFTRDLLTGREAYADAFPKRDWPALYPA